MNRIEARFQELRAAGQKAFIPYIAAGDPTLERTAEIVVALEEAGADLIELGIPFSDPLADGPVIQRATERALAGGAHLGGVLVWNDNERTFDCPLHGSRFAADGEVIEGPAVQNLRKIRD